MSVSGVSILAKAAPKPSEASSVPPAGGTEASSSFADAMAGATRPAAPPPASGPAKPAIARRSADKGQGDGRAATTPANQDHKPEEGKAVAAAPMPIAIDPSLAMVIGQPATAPLALPPAPASADSEAESTGPAIRPPVVLPSQPAPSTVSAANDSQTASIFAALAKAVEPTSKDAPATPAADDGHLAPILAALTEAAESTSKMADATSAKAVPVDDKIASAAPAAPRQTLADSGIGDLLKDVGDRQASSPAVEQPGHAAPGAGQDGQPTTPLPAAPAASPLPATAALMAARAAAQPVAVRSEAPSPLPRKAEHESDKGESGDTLLGVPRASAPSPFGAQSATQSGAALKADAAIAGTDAGAQLADAGADRQVDLARQGAWLDGLARDIASTGDANGTLKFQVAPQHLGTVQVEMRRGEDGPAVTLTASSEASRSALADARPQLIAEARAQGIHIANAQVDVGSNGTGSGTDSRSQQQGGHNEQRHAPQGSASFSAQSGGTGDGNGRSQTRSQLLAANQIREGRIGSAAKDGKSVPEAAVADGRYA